MITKAQLIINQNGLTNLSVPNNIPGNIIHINDNPAKNKPIENFIGDDGCLLPNFTHNHAKNGT